MSISAEQQPIQQGVWIERYESASKIYHYQPVSSALEYGKDWYNYVKDSNSILKYGLDLTENTVNNLTKPIKNNLEKLDDIVYPFDKYSSKQLDKIENAATSFNHGFVEPLINKTKEMRDNIVAKAVTPVEKALSDSIVSLDSKLDSVVGKSQEYMPTKINNLVSYSADTLGTVVDHLLPPQENEDLDKLSDQELFAMEKRAKFLLKLRKRTNLSSIQHIPSNSYHSFIKLSKIITSNEVAALNRSIEELSKLPKQLQLMTINLASEPTKFAIDSVYSILDDITGATASLLVYAKRYDSLEAVNSIQELFKMVRDSKTAVFAMNETNDKYNKFKEDTAAILYRASTLLKEQVDTTYSKFDQLKGYDNVIIRQTVNIVNELVGRLTKIFSKPSTPTTSNSSSSSNINNTTTSSNESTNQSSQQE